MSALPPKADIETQPRNVRFVPGGDLSRCSNVRELRLLYHLIGSHEQTGWHCQAERLCGLEIDHKLVLVWRHHKRTFLDVHFTPKS